MIASETRRIVREAIAKTGYVYNVTAAALRTGRTRIIGVSFHNIAHQFFAEILIAIEETLSAAGAAVFINNHGEDPESLTRFIASLAAYGADGLIVSLPPHVTVEALRPIGGRGDRMPGTCARTTTDGLCLFQRSGRLRSDERAQG